jgi:hypothetical protein
MKVENRRNVKRKKVDILIHGAGGGRSLGRFPLHYEVDGAP